MRKSTTTALNEAAIAQATPASATLTGQVWPLPGQSESIKSVAPWSFALNDAQMGVVSINLGAAGDPDSERRICQKAGSYGRQIGWISEAMDVVIEALRALPNGPLSRDRLDDDEIAKLDKFAALLERVEAVKRNKPRQS